MSEANTTYVGLDVHKARIVVALLRPGHREAVVWAVSHTPEFGVPPDRKQSNFTDPESRIMLTQHGWQQGYNGQIAVDADSHLIVATGLTESAADVAELVPLVEEIERIAGRRPQQVVADAGYRSEENFRQLEELGVEAVVSLGREGKKPPDRLPDRLEATRRMAERLESPEGRAAYRTRKAIAEPVVGWIKAAHGFRAFSLRGRRKVRSEWDLVALATNLWRMHRMVAV